MLTSRILKDWPIPGEEGEWLRLRMLPGKKLQEAKEVETLKQLLIFKQMGREGLEAIGEMTLRKADAVLKADPLAAYDIDTLNRAGIVGWSYDEPFQPVKVEELDEATRRAAATELLKMAKPELFADAEADAKNA